MAALNIKNEETCRLAREVAALSGKTLTQAVTDALAHELADLRRREQQSIAKRLMEISRETAPLFTPPFDTVEPGELLYGEDGLPR